MHRFYLPGTRLVGGHRVWMRERCGDGGTLAEATTIRGISIPAGSHIDVDIDFDDLTVTLRDATIVRGVVLPEGTTIRFQGRVWGFAGLAIPWWFVPLLPLMCVLHRLRSRDIWVMRDDKLAYAIRPDGSKGPIR